MTTPVLTPSQQQLLANVMLATAIMGGLQQVLPPEHLAIPEIQSTWLEIAENLRRTMESVEKTDSQMQRVTEGPDLEAASLATCQLAKTTVENILTEVRRLSSAS